MEIWVIFVVLYGIFKGVREPIKKKILEKHDLLSTLFVYTFLGFLMTIPMARNVFSIDWMTFLWIFLKAFVLFVAWIGSFVAVKKLSVGFYSVMDMSRVIFSTLLGVIFLHESLTGKGIVSLLLVILGLYLLNRKKGGDIQDADNRYAWIMLASCLLNGVSGTLDKYLMSIGAVTETQLQFWFMLLLSMMYYVYIRAKGEKPDIRGCVKNPYIYLLSILLIAGDRLLFIANSYEESKVTIMTLIKQSSAIVAILCGKFVYGEKIFKKLLCAAIIIAGIVLSVL